MKIADLRKARKKHLLAMLLKAVGQNRQLRATVARLSKLSTQPPVLRHAGHADDSVPPGWAERHGIVLPRAEGVFESATAWVRVKHGAIVVAGLKNQSILHLAISLDLLDQGAERHGSLYRDWRAAFFSRLDPTRSGGEGSDTPDAWSKEDRYSKLLHRVDQEYIAAMDAIVALKPKARHLAAFHGPKNATKEQVDEAQGVFVAAFLTVARAMAAINREAEQATGEIKG